jgi:hypothetical protein
MAITTVSRWKGNQEETSRIAREIAPILKRHGAVSVRWGPCHAGAYAGEMFRGHRLSGLGKLWHSNARFIGRCGLSEALRRSIEDRRIAGAVGDRHARALISS